MTKVISTRSPHSALLVAALISAAIAATGCTKKSDISHVTVALPNAMSFDADKASAPGELRSISRSVSATAEDDPEWNTSLNPTAGSQLNCFAIFVGGPNLTGNSCTVSDNSTVRRIDFGPNLGFLPAGSLVRMDIPSGPDRVFHVVGLRASSASACASYNNTEINSDELSEPFLIASQRANIPAGESTVEIVGALDLNKKIQTCNFVNTGGGGGGPSINISFGDERDGTLAQTTGSAWFYPGYNPFSPPTPGLVHTPKSGGVASNKIASAMKRITGVTRIGTTAGRELSTASPFTASEFEIGDEVIWHVSGGNADPGPPDDPTSGACGGDLFLGRFGFGRIQATPSSSTIILEQPITATPLLVKTANLNAPMGTNYCRISIQRVMNFQRLNVAAGATLAIMAPSYSHEDGIGGILPIRVREIQLDGTLSLQASSSGYVGSMSNAYTGGSLWGNMTPANGMAFGSGGGSSDTSLSSGAGGAGAGEGGGSSQGLPNLAVGGAPLAHGLDFRLSSISMGANHACGISEGKLFCWGNGLEAQGAFAVSSANHPPLRRTVPTASDTSIRFKQVASGNHFSCGISEADQVYCWGGGASGQLGNGTIGARLTPAMIADTSRYSKITVASSDGAHACGILAESRQLKCWGVNSNGQVGDGTTINRSAPVTVDSGTQYLDISVNGASTCGVTISGALRCWGSDAHGQFGRSTSGTVPSPTNAAMGLTFKQVRVGIDFVCGITTTDQVKCSGRNVYGNLGDGTTTDRNLFANIGVAGVFRQVATASRHACAITLTGNLYCWGANGQLGNGDISPRLTPTPISGLTFASVTAANKSTCGITAIGMSYCWGGGLDGQLGNGSTHGSLFPQRVRTQNYTLPLSGRKLYFGGGGGGGGGGDGFLAVGGNGGGFVFLMVDRIQGGGTLNLISNGANGGAGGNMSGGGGGGGVISAAIKRTDAATNVNILAVGGTGEGGASAGPSGGGGGGATELYLCAAEAPASINASVFGGLGGDQSNFGDRGIYQSVNLPALCNAN